MILYGLAILCNRPVFDDSRLISVIPSFPSQIEIISGLIGECHSYIRPWGCQEIFKNIYYFILGAQNRLWTAFLGFSGCPGRRKPHTSLNIKY